MNWAWGGGRAGGRKCEDWEGLWDCEMGEDRFLPHVGKGVWLWLLATRSA